jgi:predicted amidophosphoribosyltransferase
MPLRVVSFCGYFCNHSMQWRPEDWTSYKFVQALKGKDLNKYADVLVRGQFNRLSNDNRDDAAKWFGFFVADYLTKREVAGPFLVVPVPNSSCTVSSQARPRTRKLARAICDALGDGSTVLDCLRWKENLGSASKEGGPREPKVLYGNLVLALPEAVDKNLKVLLVDDVKTSGGHVRACAAKLTSKKLGVEIVVCGGKTVYDQDKPAFHVYEDAVDEYQP